MGEIDVNEGSVVGLHHEPPLFPLTHPLLAVDRHQTSGRGEEKI